MIRRALRGRYGRVIVVGLVGMTLGGLAGWKYGRPQYRSEARIRIAAVQQKSRPGQSEPIPMYEQNMRTHEAVLGSRNMVAAGLMEAEWQAVGRGDSRAEVEDVYSRLTVERPTGTEHLKVIYADSDPKVAAAGVRSIVNAFAAHFNRSSGEFEQRQREVLEASRASLQIQLSALEARLKEIAEDYGAANLEVLYSDAVRRVTLLEPRVLDLRVALSQAQSGATAQARAEQRAAAGHGAPTSRPAGSPVRALSLREIEKTDATMHEYLAAERRAREELAHLRSLGFANNHPQVTRLAAQLQRASESVEAYAQDYREYEAIRIRYPGAGASAARGDVTAAAQQPVDVLQSDYDTLARMLDQGKREVISLGGKKSDVGPFRLQAEKVRAELDQLDDDLKQINRAVAMGGRLEVLSTGNVPFTPHYDPRKKYAAVGAMGLGGLPVAVLLLLGVVNRRYRFSDEAENDLALSAQAPLLGILPALPSPLSDPDQAAAAAQCIHQMRVLLQVGSHDNGEGVYLVSSSAAGEGKTSLAVSLALSFAASGSRTLAIDCDIVGRRMSRGFQTQDFPGLHDALAAGTTKGFARKTSTGLYVLPVGTTDSLHANSFSASGMRRLLADARQYFDTIIIDSGPILGSVEATAVAPLVDGVVFAVSRGQQPLLVERALKQLQAIRAVVAGFVFNRAQARDFGRSSTGSSLRSVLPVDGVRPDWPRDAERWSYFGPVVQSVAGLLPVCRAARSPVEVEAS
jgi:Mrp family chromosome partitioning ATPase